jgi:putative oxidoreductase
MIGTTVDLWRRINMNIIKNDALGKLVLRLTLGLLILFHGVSKLMHGGSLGMITEALASHGIPGFVAYGVFVGEIIAPVMIVLGVFSRLGGLLVVINMLFAIGLMHMGQLLMINDHGGYQLEPQAFYLFSGLAVLFLGSGRFAINPD